jgi:ribosomal protein S18 acetylase RimI-like enzyme
VSATVRQLTISDYDAAEQIIKTSFSDKLGIPDPDLFFAGGSLKGRLSMDPDGAFGAEEDGRLVGVNIATSWGSCGYLGPLAVSPGHQGQGVAQQLLMPVMSFFRKRNVTHAGLFTFPESAQHIHLYRKFGFMPRFLTAIMSKPLEAAPAKEVRVWRYSGFQNGEQADFRDYARELTNEIYPGLDLQKEICAVQELGMGDTVFIGSDALDGFAICHYGEGSEAKRGSMYIKFAAARLCANSAVLFNSLLMACESIAREEGVSKIAAGMSTARDAAFESMLTAGFKTDYLGVYMHKPNEPGYCRPDVFAIDDWR